MRVFCSFTGSLLFAVVGFAADPIPKLPETVLNQESMISFDPQLVALRRIDNRYQLFAEKQLIKDFGKQEREANEAVRVIRELKLTQYGTLPGAQPPFEYWLIDGKVPHSGFGNRLTIPFQSEKLKVEQVLGAWCVRDEKRVIFNFGKQREMALEALAILKKYGFNQLNIIGQPSPVMSFLTVDDYANMGRPEPKSSALEVASTIAQQGVVLPNVGYIGSRMPMEYRKIEVERFGKDWFLIHGKEILGNFALNESLARDAQRCLRDLRVTDLCRVGATNFPIYLANNQLPKGVPLGVHVTSFQINSLKIKDVGRNWCVCEGNKTLFEFGEQKDDAELLVKVLQQLQGDQIWQLGMQTRGMRIIGRSR